MVDGLKSCTSWEVDMPNMFTKDLEWLNYPNWFPGCWQATQENQCRNLGAFTGVSVVHGILVPTRSFQCMKPLLTGTCSMVFSAFDRSVSPNLHPQCVVFASHVFWLAGWFLREILCPRKQNIYKVWGFKTKIFSGFFGVLKFCHSRCL